MRVRQTEPLDSKAEGLCCGLPYSTELAGPGGCSIHFWVGDACDKTQLEKALHVARGNRDIVRASWSLGQPAAFWSNEDMGK